MAELTWHQVDSDGTTSCRSAENCTVYDVELYGTTSVGDNPCELQPIRALKSVLMRASKNFDLLFAVCNDSRQVKFKCTEVEHDILGDVVGFIYTGNLNFQGHGESERIRKILIAAKFLVIPALFDACETYLASDEHLNLENCMCMLRFARKYACLSLLDAVLSLAARNLPHFIGSSDFLGLNEEEVGKLLLSEPVITHADADARCRAAVAWLNHDRPARDAFVGDILNMVPFDLNTLSLETLVEVKKNSGIRSEYAEKFMDAIYDGVEKYEKQRFYSNRTVSNVLWNAADSDVWYVMGGIDAPTECVIYDVKRRYWSKLRDLPWSRTAAGACVVMGNTVLVLGGEKNKRVSADIDQFDLSTHEWTTSSTKLSVGRNCVSACVTGHNNDQTGLIVGGNPNATNFVEKMRCVSGDDGKVLVHLEVAPKMCAGRCHAPAVYVDDAFFAVGFRANLTLSSIEKYDDIANKWSPVGNMNCVRSSHMAAVLGDDLYFAGGWNPTLDLIDSVEIFNVRTGQIRQAPNMLSSRSAGSGVTLDRNTFCVMGGRANGSPQRSLRTVECYDVREGKWSTGTIVPDMPTANWWFSFANV